MIRGCFVLITTDENGERHYYTSTEFNGGMAVRDREDVLSSYTSEHIHNVKEWEDFVSSFNEKKFHYKDEWLYGEITDGSELYVTENLYDLTSYHGKPDYSYWLNLGEDDIEVWASEVVLIPSMGGAVFHYDTFLSTEWNAHVIPAKESKDFKNEAMAYEKVKNGNLSEKEAREWLQFNTSGMYKIETIYSGKEDLGEDLLLTHLSLYGILESQAMQLREDVLDGYFDYAKYAERFLNQDGYLELNSGKVIKYMEME